MILVFTQTNTNRFRYVCRFLVETIAGGQVKFTSDETEFLNWNGPKFTYLSKLVEGVPGFIPAGLLAEKSIVDHEITVWKEGELPGLFVVRKNLWLPFDPFSAAFFLLSRYEEYLPHRKDEHGRFEPAGSILVREELIEEPLVDQWGLAIRDIILSVYPQATFHFRKFRFISTLDIDSAWAFREKGIPRQAGGMLKSAVTLDIPQVVERTRVLTGISPDPFDTFSLQIDLQQKYNAEVIYFILVADYGHNNKNVSHMNESFRKLLKRLADVATVGIHPGYSTYRNKTKMQQEMSRLEEIINREIIRSRQHFLRLSLPETYRNLIESGIQEDYTMGFASRCGFRAGTCTPFPFYDLDQDIETTLLVYPFTYMEGTLVDYMKLTPEQGRAKVDKLMRSVKEVNGTFISLWHNESLSDRSRWEGWSGLYEHTLKQAAGYGV